MSELVPAALHLRTWPSAQRSWFGVHVATGAGGAASGTSAGALAVAVLGGAVGCGATTGEGAGALGVHATYDDTTRPAKANHALFIANPLLATPHSKRAVSSSSRGSRRTMVRARSTFDQRERKSDRVVGNTNYLDLKYELATGHHRLRC
jgi:hypothetical protein